MLRKPTLQDISKFQQILSLNPKARILQDPVEINSYTTDWSKQYTGTALAVLQPADTQQVSAILQYCNDQKLPVVPQGGLTGLVGGSVPSDKYPGIILNTSRMTRILKVSPIEHYGSFQAGVVLEAADVELQKHGLMVPIDLGSKGSCQMGGLVACNAGGSRFRRYGSLHANVAGLEVVLPSGQILDLRGTLRKRNTGLDLKHLFIGSEGTLGVVTQVDLFCPRRPTAIALAVLSVPTFDLVPSIYHRATAQLAMSMAAFEFWDGSSEELVYAKLKKSIRQGTEKPAFSVMIELNSTSDDSDYLDSQLQSFLEDLIHSDAVTDAVVATDLRHQQQMWAVREGISEACSLSGYVHKYDITLPLESMYNVTQLVRERVQVRKVVGFGHVGDGNLHLNVITDDCKDKQLIDEIVYSYVQRSKGSISAEHGIGQLKLLQYMKYTDPLVLSTAKGIKDLLDPHGIMNPGKLFPVNN